MLSFLRNLTKSKVGVIVTFVALIVIALAFAAGGVSRIGGGPSGGAPAATTIAQVGKTTISADALKNETQNEMNGYRQQQPTLDMATFIQGGGFDATVDRLINALALQQFGERQGMVVSKKAIDGQIASIPSLQGVDGKFDPRLYQQLLQQQNLTDAGIRGEIAQSTYGQMLTDATVNAAQVPQQLAAPYASLLLEKRSGQIGIVPTRAMPDGTPPTEQQIAAFYRAHIAGYTIPERRVIRYAVVNPDTVKAMATPTEAEIAQAYKAQQGRFAATEKRTLKQVIVADQNAAAALAKRVQGGMSLDDAAKAAGLEALSVPDVTKADYAKQSSADVANAVFAANGGAVVGPIKAPLGWSVIRIEKVTQVPGQTLAQAHDTLAKEITTQKENDLLGQVHDKIDDAVTGGSTFDEIVGDQKLSAQQTPAVTQAGADPENPNAKPDPNLTQVIASGFDAQEGDSPELVPVGQTGAFAIVSLGKVVPAAPPPLAKIHDAVAHDVRLDRATTQAQQIARSIAAAIDKGTPIAQAFAAAKVPLPPTQHVSVTRAQMAANPNGAPPPLALLFETPAHKAKVLEAPNNVGWLVVYTDAIDRGDASNKPDVVKATRNDLGHFVGREYAEEFATAVSRQIGVKRNASAIAGVRKQLLGQGGDAQP